MASFDGTAIDDVLRGAVARGDVPGAVVTVHDRNGVRFETGHGDLPDGLRTMFRFASMTKALTSVAALQLVEAGKIALDAPVASVIPAFGEAQVLVGFDGDTPRLRPPARAATIRHLLTHTAGHGYLFTNPDLHRYHRVTGLPTPFDGCIASLSAPLIADPGTRWEYGINTDWLGRVVESVSGQGLDVHLAKAVFEPLGMRDATFTPTAVQRARLMPIRSRTPQGTLAPSPLDLPGAPEFQPGGHGAYGTPADYGRFVRALLRGGELDGARILRPETTDLMFSDQLGDVPMPTSMPAVMPEWTNQVPAPPTRQTWGLGLQVSLEDMPGMRPAGTGSWAGIFNSYYWIDRTTGIAATFFTQVLPFFDVGVVPALLAVEHAVYAQSVR
ncbi:MAG TPA: serine hydrolase domain-containing protein [Candidatus Binatia bacterium]|jgi:CubicO group peptidase (beta-lactamase class C family)|nr:serine hydrolase domain-containing protein [Candidatus Binatia bacterium]